jgi:uncharacterized protein YndB with AHSA1/START domain
MRRTAVTREIDAPASVVWDVVVDLDQWPSWGPSVRSAQLDGGGRRLSEGATGSVTTPVGVSVPFVVTEWADAERWTWDVAGLPATTHVVRSTGRESCRLTFAVPWFAAPYLAVCRVALGRIARIVGG